MEEQPLKKRLRKAFYTSLVLLAVVGLIFTLKLDTSTPTIPQTTVPTNTATSTQPTAVSVAFTDISYTLGDVGLQFTTDDNGQWLWLDDPDFPLDGSYLETMSQGLDVLSAQQTIVLEETQSLSEYGLDKPWASVTAVRSDGSAYTFAFGNATTDGKAHYATKNGDETTVYIYGTDWLAPVHLPIYDMCALPTLPTLDGEAVVSVVINQGETSQSLSLDMQGTTATWTSGTDVVEAPGLLPALCALQLEKCFSFKPSEKAVTICGFDAPTATISVTYNDENGETMRLLVYLGTLAMDESYRYVRYNDDTTIYLLDASTADALFTLTP